MYRRVLLLLACAGCRQIFGIGDPTRGNSDADDTTIDTGAADAPVDVLAPASCMTRWLTTPAFGAATPLTGVNTSDDEDNPFVTFDELSIYFTFKNDIFVAKRSTTQGSFAAPKIESNLSSGATEGKASISHDETRAFFVSDRNPGSGGLDLWRGSRPDPNSAFAVDRMYVSSVDDASSQVDPHLSPDLLRLYFIPSAGVAQHIAVAARNNTSQDFGNPTTITELAGIGGSDSGPTLTDDERVIVFASTRDGAQHLYYATRSGPNGAFSSPARIPNLSDAGIDGAPHLSSDGCHLYFMSTRISSRDLFVATML